MEESFIEKKEKSLVELLEGYMDEDGDYFPARLWTLRNVLKSFLKSTLEEQRQDLLQSLITEIEGKKLKLKRVEKFSCDYNIGLDTAIDIIKLRMKK